ncbi:MFS multidrug transporter-like protein [Macrophomina phaseolina]|uniref:MFS multidrug transporter-like protein n=1 Tax=Macrophomina phaseolina TaxID=35725 RepID=A0ABQ8FUB6_9PEZI|nr:MFS multidrug transporter-like protein [Macrophomina phaseolina]
MSMPGLEDGSGAEKAPAASVGLSIAATDESSDDGFQDPKKWATGKRVFHTALPALYGFVVTLSTSTYSAGIEQLSAEFSVSEEVALLGLSLFSLGLALGPMLAAPISELAGRKAVYVFTLPAFMLFTAGAGLARDCAALIICRFFAAAFGSPVLAVGAGTIADIWQMERGGGLATVIVTSTFFLGPAAGPVIGGYTMASRGDWRWLMWATLIGAAPVWIAALFSSETSVKHLRKKHAASPPAGCPPSATFKTLLVITLLRPLRMLVLEPIVAAFALYHAFVFGVLYAFFDGFPYIYGTVYHFRAEKAGLGFVGILVGVVLAPATFVILGRIQQAATKNAPQSPRSPEARLYICMLSGFGTPISLFWTAWSAKRDVSWLVPMFAGIPFGWGVVCLFLGGATYIVDTYGPLYSASAMAANGLLRYIAGAAFPLFTTQMYEALGIAWATSLIGFVSVFLLPIPFALFKFGPKLRMKSHYRPS